MTLIMSYYITSGQAVVVSFIAGRTSRRLRPCRAFSLLSRFESYVSVCLLITSDQAKVTFRLSGAVETRRDLRCYLYRH